MILDLMGPSLDKLHSVRPGVKFSLKTTIMIGI